MSKVIQKRAQKFRLWSKIFIAGTVVVLAATAYIGYTKYIQISDFKDKFGQTSTFQKTLEVEKIALDESYAKARKRYIDDQKQISQKIDAIFPIKSEITRLTRLLDVFFNKNNTPQNPLFLSNLAFSESTLTTTSDDYAAISFTMNIEGSKNNFFKVLDYLYDSGSFSDEPYRLMEIKNVSLSLPEKTTFISSEGGGESINFTIEAVAYFKKPVSDTDTE